MIDNPRSPRVRAVAKLAKRNARAETGLFLVEGPQAVGEILTYAPHTLVDLFATRQTVERYGYAGAATRAGIEAEIVSDAVISAMADTVTPQGVVAVAQKSLTPLEELLATGPRLLAVLHEVRDPGNAGTIIRAADATGADGVILTGKSVDPYNPKVVRSTTGSLFHLPVVQSEDLDATLDAIRAAGLRILAADIGGEELPEVAHELSSPTAWLFGNEAHGLTDDERALADRSVRLPIYGRAESLNLATAASVCLYQSAFAQRVSTA